MDRARTYTIIVTRESGQWITPAVGALLGAVSMSEPPGIMGEMTSIEWTELLSFEEQWPRWSGRKDEAIRARFGIPPARYFQILGRVIDSVDALEMRPLLVHRLRRRRDADRSERQRRAG